MPFDYNAVCEYVVREGKQSEDHVEPLDLILHGNIGLRDKVAMLDDLVGYPIPMSEDSIYDPQEASKALRLVRCEIMDGDN